jgi:hypothetical protein
VYLDDTPPFDATTKKRVPQYAISQFVPGQTVVAVRVSADHSKVGIDLATDPPEVRMAAGSGQGSAADILANGTPCEAVIVQFEPTGMKNSQNIDVYAFLLTIMADGVAPYQITVGNPMPAEALPLVYPGSKVPACFDPNGPKEAVAIDWQAALDAASGGATV